jgi:signal transduction histidine kinase
VGARSDGGAFGVSESAPRERLAILVHEVRSPVAALAAIAEASRGPGLAHDALRSFVTLAVAACRGIERNVLDASLASVRLEPVDLGRLVHEAVAIARLGGARVRAEVESDLPHVRADALRVRQALDNLVDNAVAHSGSDADLVVSARERDGQLLLSVADEGRGIPADEHERIFDVGTRLDGSVPGSGLGLAVVRAVADAHGATLQLESAPGRGSTFTLVFPRS